MTRLRDWQSRFARLVAETRARPFVWGTHDCCLWAADAVEATMGRDPAAKWRGSYSTQAQALALLGSLGGLPGVAALGGSEIAVAFAITGDIGLARWPDGTPSLAVCAGGPRWLVVADHGLLTLEDCASRAWGVGRV